MNNLVLLAYRYALNYGHSYDDGMTDWLTHMVMSSLVHAPTYGFIFRLVHHLMLTKAAVLMGSAPLILFI